MPDQTFEEVKPNLYRFTIRKEPHWDDPSYGYHLEMIVAFPEVDEKGRVRMWYSHHEHYSRKKKNLRWRKDEEGAEMTYDLSRDLKESITRHACRAWWRHCYSGKIGYLRERRDPDNDRAKKIAQMMEEPGRTVQ